MVQLTDKSTVKERDFWLGDVTGDVMGDLQVYLMGFHLVIWNTMIFAQESELGYYVAFRLVDLTVYSSACGHVCWEPL